MSRRSVEVVRRDWGSDDEGCSILHVDMDAFFASVELARRPELRGRPVIVGGAERSVVLAASYPARRFGVHSAMPMSRARRLCPDAVVIPPDHRRYREVSDQVMATLREVTSVVEQISVDEAFLDVSGARRRVGRPVHVAERIRAQVAAEQQITCSVGIATTKSVAKLASGFAKPDGVLLVPRGATTAFLRSLPVAALWGVGERTEEALARWGITTVAQLADADLDTVQRAVGRLVGAHLHDLAWGRDPRPVTPERPEKSIGAETTLDRDTHDQALVDAHLVVMADRCARTLRAKRLRARTVAIKVRTADFVTLSRSRTLAAPTDVAADVLTTARALVAATDLAGKAVRLIGVRVEGLDTVAVQQPTLEEAVAAFPSDRRDAEVAMDAVRARFGQGAIASGSVLTRNHGQLPQDAAETYPEGDR